MTASSLHINDQATWRGGEQQVSYLLKGLKERGERAELIAQPESVLGRLAREAKITVHPIRMRGELDIVAARQIARLIRSKGFDVVHMHTAHAHTLGCLASAFNPRPLCIVSRRVDFPINQKPLGIPALKYRWRVDHYIAISKAVKQVLVNGGVRSKKISIVHSGVAPRTPFRSREEVRQTLGLADDAPLVGNIGALVDHKGHRYLIEAIPLVLKKVPAAKFVIIGDGELRESLEALSSRLGIDDAIMFLGFQADPISYLAAIDLFVAPSHMEGLNTSIIDAMMLARPIVATQAGGIPELVENERTGLLVPPKNPGALADAIVRLLGNPEKAAELARAAREKAMEHFTADRMVEGTLAVYSRLLEEKWKS
ncbi:MAG: glycosyltransferase family 1 protein [Candidatus Abyssobacteria bacterium SURF_5]|uniref:Glycosyltransferase family 1 protein n=1 Tax=Abyssobacteria bacterium (strain SURF_5) TaxID=2093360 RepID=A0A3A4NVT1_ABYX5|nr:MAG: glycosyltransferase family 1 protein [Candidatus Abyssubacteria bacterium SURF_5]